MMLVGADRVFLSQRKVAQMATIAVTLGDGRLTVLRDGCGTLDLPVEPEGEDLDVTVWQSTVRARRVSPHADRWFSAALGLPCSLVAMTSATERQVNQTYGRPGEQVSFADGFPLLLTNAASLDDLNQRLHTPVPMSRFRPNIEVAGAPAWEEDGWMALQCGDVQLRVVKPCGRCLVTTTDQETGERGVEPLQTLATFRQVG